MEFVTIAYKTPYYSDTAHIYYDNVSNKYIIAFKDNNYAIMEKEEMKKGEAEINGNVWKFTKVMT